jgi:beta-N-acetylhexosaminidase
MIKKFFACLFAASGIFFTLHAQPEKERWVDSVFSKLNTNEKIGQLFMIRLSPEKADNLNDAETKIRGFNIGGIIVERGHPTQVARAINRLQQDAEVPLIVGMDAANGINTDSTVRYPGILSLGAIRHDSMIYVLGKEIARQMKLVGANLNFAPVADVLKPQDTAISYHSFGEDRYRVAAKAIAFMNGLREGGILSCARYFPVQGLTIMNVEKGIPAIKPTIDSVQAYPYQKLFEQGLTGVVPATADFPLFYPNVGLTKKNKFNSAGLSSLFTGDWLKKNMNFKGLVFTDVPGVQNFTEKYRSGEAEMFAFQAGNDILIDPRDIGPAIRKIKKLVRDEESYAAQLDATVRKILTAKYDAGLWRPTPAVNTDNLALRLNTTRAQLLRQKLSEATVTVIRDVQKTLPIKTLENKRFAYLTDDATEAHKPFYHYLTRYVNVSAFTVGDKTDLLQLADALKDQEVIVIGVFPQTPLSVIGRLKRLMPLLSPATHQIILCDFGNQLILRSADQFPSIVTAYTDTPEMLRAVPEVIFGALKADGILPFTASAQAEVGAGVQTPFLRRLSYSVPEDAGMDGRILQKIDNIAAEALKIGATPGCQIIVAKNGKVVYDKSFGYLTYDSTARVTDETIYDLASLTKVSATLQTVMFMYEKGLIDINKKISYYIPELKKTNKKDLTIIDMLTHQAGLVPFIPLWPQTMKDSVYLPQFYSRAKSVEYPLQVAPDLFASPVIRDSVWMWVIRSKMQEKPARTPYTYRYSDLGFMMMHYLAERILNQPIDEFLKQNFYEPLGAYSTGYTPLNSFPPQLIAPTEDDRIYRKAMIVGTVHDERAAMMGGIAGHAGLFSSANDLAKLGQMLLQEGSYGGYQYFKPETLRLFTHKQFEKSRRGLGWDKPVQSDAASPASLFASPRTFGHTGFTGTCMWVDPEFNLVYIFLSNRVFPDRNNKLINSNIRTRIQDVIYQSIFNYCTYSQ